MIRPGHFSRIQRHCGSAPLQPMTLRQRASTYTQTQEVYVGASQHCNCVAFIISAGLEGSQLRVIHIRIRVDFRVCHRRGVAGILPAKFAPTQKFPSQVAFTQAVCYASFKSAPSSWSCARKI